MSKAFGQPAEVITTGNFGMENHYYPRVLNAQLHSMVAYFLNLSTQNLINRYCHLNPRVKRATLETIFSYKPRYMPWAGADLFHVTTEDGVRQMVLIETNTCPSGQKSMPLLNEHQEHGGYMVLMERTFKPLLSKRGLPTGKLAVVYDKNYMEASGYAAALADVMHEEVLLAGYYDGDPDPCVRFSDRVMEVRDDEGRWHPIRAAFRYLTQRPWNRIPLQTRTLIVNPTLACLAGGRNKMIAAKAYDLYNAELAGSGLAIHVPETIRDVHKTEIPLWVKKFGGHAVIKNPYSNAGQGVYTITNEEELEAFMDSEQVYEQFIVQSLIGNYEWSTIGTQGKFYHVGTMPNRKDHIYVADIRMMVSCISGVGLRPLAIYSRRSHTPLREKLGPEVSSWDMLGTNLSIRLDDGTWDTDTKRLLLMDRRDFNKLGIGVDDLIKAYIQTVLAVIAIDRMAHNLLNQKGKFRKKLFRSLNNDEALFQEIQL